LKNYITSYELLIGNNPFLYPIPRSLVRYSFSKKPYSKKVVLKKSVPVHAHSGKKVAQFTSCKRSQVLQMCVIRAISYSFLCWLPLSHADAVPVNAYKNS
jgi:hypothetical protein